MKESKIKDRIESSFHDQFQNEIASLQVAGNSASFTAVGDQHADGGILKNLKELFLFLPGAFLLFQFTLLPVGFFINALLSPETLPPLQWFRVLPILFLLDLAGVFMTWFGLGDLKNKKHWVVPGSIAATGALTGFLFALLHTILPIAGGPFYPFLLFPLALIAAVVAKARVEGKES